MAGDRLVGFDGHGDNPSSGLPVQSASAASPKISSGLVLPNGRPGPNAYEILAFLSQANYEALGTTMLPSDFQANKTDAPLQQFGLPAGVGADLPPVHSFEFHFDAATTWNFWKYVKDQTGIRTTYKSLPTGGQGNGAGDGGGSGAMALATIGPTEGLSNSQGEVAATGAAAQTGSQLTLELASDPVIARQIDFVPAANLPFSDRQLSRNLLAIDLAMPSVVRSWGSPSSLIDDDSMSIVTSHSESQRDFETRYNQKLWMRC